MSEKELADLVEMDEQGNLVMRPVLGWISIRVEGMLFWRVRYSETPNIPSKRIQLVLTPQAALHLSEELTRQARRIIDAPPPEQSQN